MSMLPIQGRQGKAVFLALILAVLPSSRMFSQNLLDAVKNESKLVSELKDVYKAFHINHIVEEQKELINLYQEEDEEETKKVLGGFIKSCDSLRDTEFYNDTLSSLVQNFLKGTVQSYELAQARGFGSEEFKQDFQRHSGEVKKYMSFLYSRYSTSQFISMNEDAYWKANDKSNYIKSKAYLRYKDIKKSNLKSSWKLLDSIARHTADFQERAIYQIELADQYEKRKDSLGDDATATAIAKYKSVLEEKKYSIYLFEAWLKWRAVTQQNEYGLSKTSDIPNNEYDKVREQAALTVLNHIVQNPKDEMAINEFLLLATHDIVKRFGDYPYGNQNTVEYHQLFDQ